MKYEYLERVWFNSRGFNFIKNLNDLGEYGYLVVSIQYVPMLDNPNEIWQYKLLLAKKIC